MKMKNKHVFFILVVGVTIALIMPVWHGRCVSEIVRDESMFKDCEREMCLALSFGKDLEYWIDGERSTDGCHWHLEHVKCQSGDCLYKCKETEVLWHLVRDGKAIKMVKDVKGTSSSLPQEYRYLSQ